MNNCKGVLFVLLIYQICLGCSENKSSEMTYYSEIEDDSIPQLKFSYRNDTVRVSGATCSDLEYFFPMRYVKYEYTVSKEEKAKEEKARMEIRNERLNSPRRIHFVFDGTYNGYNVDVVIHPDSVYEDTGMARYHFKSNTHNFYIETAFTWNWAYCVPDYEKVKYNGETYHVKLDPQKVVQGTNNVIVRCDPFFFKDVDFDGDYEILFCVGGYNRIYYTSYKIISRNRAEYMSNKPYNNLVEMYESSLEDDADTSSDTNFDYDKRTITINEPSGCCDYYHDVYILNPKSHDRMNPMMFLEGKHTEGGALYHKHEYLSNKGLDSVDIQYYTNSSNWNILVTYKKVKKDVRLTNVELINIHDEKIRRPLSWK